MWSNGPDIWWISQVQTFEASSAGEDLWAPLADRRGHPRWARLRELKPEDITVHYSRGGVKAIGQVRSYPYDTDCPKGLKDIIPDLYPLPGRRVDVKYHTLRPMIPLADMLSQLRDLDIDHGPLDKNGRPKQAYVSRFSLEGLKRLHSVSTSEWPESATHLL